MGWTSPSTSRHARSGESAFHTWVAPEFHVMLTSTGPLDGPIPISCRKLDDPKLPPVPTTR